MVLPAAQLDVCGDCNAKAMTVPNQIAVIIQGIQRFSDGEGYGSGSDSGKWGMREAAPWRVPGACWAEQRLVEARMAELRVVMSASEAEWVAPQAVTEMGYPSATGEEQNRVVSMTIFLELRAAIPYPSGRPIRSRCRCLQATGVTHWE